LGKYPDAIIYLNELLKKTDFQYRDDVVRYLFLSYIKIENYKKAFELYKEFLQTPSANVYDFWTFFNYFLFNDKGYDIVQNNKKDVLKIIKQCYKSVGKHYIYVCRY
jgi:tetratricopeptide (TPR) repeat protein